MECKSFQKGEIIFRQSEPGRELYEIKSGRVGIYAAYGTPEEKKLTELEAGRIFGEMAVIDVLPRSATAVALEDTEAEAVTGADVQAFFEDRPEKLLEIMRGMSRRLRELTEDYREVCESIGEWKDATEQGREKRSGLMATIRKFAKIFMESTQYMSSPGIGMYYSFYTVY